MNPGGVGDFARPWAVREVKAGGTRVDVEASAEECGRLAAGLGLVALHSLVGRFLITGTPERVRVQGTITAGIEQVCVVTLDPFESVLEEEVDVAFVEPRDDPGQATLALDVERDEPDEIVGASLDLGALAAEFLALGLDPYPRKPGVAFEETPRGEPTDHPFAALAKLNSDKS